MLKLTLALNLILATAYLFPHVSAASRIRPSAGSVIVRAGTTTLGEFQTVSGAVKSLPNDNSPTTIFIYPGTYAEQVVITRPGPLTIFGYTKKHKILQIQHRNHPIRLIRQYIRIRRRKRNTPHHQSQFHNVQRHRIKHVRAGLSGTRAKPIWRSRWILCVFLFWVSRYAARGEGTAGLFGWVY